MYTFSKVDQRDYFTSCPDAESEQFSDGNEMGGELFALASEHKVFLVGKAKVVRANASFKGNTKVSGTKRLLAVITVILILKLKRALKLLNEVPKTNI